MIRATACSNGSSSSSREKRARKRGIVPQKSGSGSDSLPFADDRHGVGLGDRVGPQHEPPQRLLVPGVAAVAVVDDPRGAAGGEQEVEVEVERIRRALPGGLAERSSARVLEPGRGVGEMERVPAHLEQDVAGDAALDPRRPWRPRRLDEVAAGGARPSPLDGQREHRVEAEVGDDVRERLERASSSTRCSR